MSLPPAPDARPVSKLCKSRRVTLGNLAGTPCRDKRLPPDLLPQLYTLYTSSALGGLMAPPREFRITQPGTMRQPTSPEPDPREAALRALVDALPPADRAEAMARLLDELQHQYTLRATAVPEWISVLRDRISREGNPTGD